MKAVKILSIVALTSVLCMTWAGAAYSAILVVSSKGDSTWQDSGQWKPLSKGQTLAEGVKISTGVNSSVVLNIDGTVLTVKPMTSIKVYKNLVDEAKRETNIGLQYGAVRAKVNKLDKVRTRFNVTTPVATSSVRGTEEIVSYGAISGMRVEVLEGNIEAFNDLVSNTISGRLVFNLLSDSARADALNGDTRAQTILDVVAGGVAGGEGNIPDSKGFEGSSDFGTGGRTAATSRVNFNIVFPQ